MLIREKEMEDIPEFVLLINEVWNETYKGIFDDDFLDNMKNTVYERIKIIKENFSEKDSYSYVLVDKNRLVGYTSVDKSRDEDYPEAGELSSLYLLKEYHGNGYGKMLYEFSLNKIKDLGYKNFIVGCLDKNPTNEFYKKMGGKLYKQKLKKIGNKEYIENYYLFNVM